MILITVLMNSKMLKRKKYAHFLKLLHPTVPNTTQHGYHCQYESMYAHTDPREVMATQLCTYLACLTALRLISLLFHKS